MPISSLLITLEPDAESQAIAHSWLSSRPSVTIGQLHGLRLPAVLETTTLREGRQMVDDMLDVQGIRFVDVLGVNFEDAGV